MAKRATAAQRRARAKFAAKYAHKKRKAKSKHTKHTRKRSASKRKTTKRKRAAKRGGHKLLVHKGKLYTYYGQVER